MDISWVENFFEPLSEIEYVVLRNYELFAKEEFLVNHPDIDILCGNPNKVKEMLSLSPKKEKDDGIHYIAEVKGIRIPVDLRTVGDGYLDAEWEKEILKKRIKIGCFYVIDKYNYFFSLLYHAYIQKYSVSQDYNERLIVLGKDLEIEYNLDNAIILLDSFIREHNYKYTIPKYIGTIANFEKVDPKLVETNMHRTIRRKLQKIKTSICKKFKG